MIKWLIIAGLGASFLPVWRAAGNPDGMNFWQYMRYVSTEEYWELHVPYDYALDTAREAEQLK